MARAQLPILLGSSAECLRTFPFCLRSIVNNTRLHVRGRTQMRVCAWLCTCVRTSLNIVINMYVCICLRPSTADSNGNFARILRLRIRHSRQLGFVRWCWFGLFRCEMLRGVAVSSFVVLGTITTTIGT